MEEFKKGVEESLDESREVLKVTNLAYFAGRVSAFYEVLKMFDGMEKEDRE